MAKVSTNISIDADLKKQAAELFNALGMDLSTGINVYLKKAVAVGGIPFDVSVERPNEVTLAAIEEGEEILADPTRKHYKSTKELWAALTE